jgi:hypothetical protein
VQSNFVFKCGSALDYSLRLYFPSINGGALNDEYFALIRKLFHPRSMYGDAQPPPATALTFQGSCFFFVCCGILLQIIAIKISPSVILHES